MPSATSVSPSSASEARSAIGSTSGPTSTRNSIASIAPPMAPSMVFFGLIMGARARRPNSRPV
ncbi:hypothetical protein D3C83_331110 [compost metagenome]